MIVKKLKIWLTVTLAIVLIFAACKKETSRSSYAEDKKFSEIISVSDIESAEVFDDVYNNVMGVNSEVAYGETGVFGRIITVDSFANPCFTVRTTRLNAPAPFPLQVTLDFGVGCAGKDGVSRKGKIITYYSGPLTQSGKAAKTSFDDFYINDLKVEGSYRIENAGYNQQQIFKVTIKDGKITKMSGNYTLYNSNITIKQIEGFATPAYAKDDVLTVTTESNGSIKNDSIFLNWNSKTIEPLIKKFTCRWIVQGKTELLQSSADAGIIDFGNGDCDNKANLIINNSTTEITLH